MNSRLWLKIIAVLGFCLFMLVLGASNRQDVTFSMSLFKAAVSWQTNANIMYFGFFAGGMIIGAMLFGGGGGGGKGGSKKPRDNLTPLQRTTVANFADRLAAAIDAKKSVVVVGLDPRLDALPPQFRELAARGEEQAAEAVVAFNDEVIRAVAPYAVAAKPQAAFYEALGWPGFRAYIETIRICRERGLLVIADAKRNDIGSTAEAYAEAHLDRFGADAITVNPYLGSDGIAPFLKRAPAGKGIFALVRTSNPSAADIQDLKTDRGSVCDRVAELVEKWNGGTVGQCGYGAAGAVVGATYPEDAARLRKLMPHAFFLVPGYGAQGGSAQDCKPCFDAKGLGAVVNSSRGIIFAYGKSTGPGWQTAVANAARQMRDEIEKVRLGR